MKKINIIIAKRGRDDYLKLVLHNFNQSDNIRDYNLEIYIGEDIEKNINKIDYSIYDNIKVKHLYIASLPQSGNLFCKGYILDSVIQNMRPDYDFLCIVDVDIVYCKSFFNDMVAILRNGTSCNFCLNTSGFYTSQNIDYKKILRENHSYEEILSNSMHVEHPGCSQISITKAYHETMKNKLGIKSIYDTHSLGYYFMGWGREDTLVRKILTMSKSEVITKHEAWVHVWHETQGSKEDSLLYNNSILRVLEEEVKGRMKKKFIYSPPWKKKLSKLINKVI